MTDSTKWIVCPDGTQTEFDYRDEARTFAQFGHACVSEDLHKIKLQASAIAKDALKDFPRCD